MNKKIIVFLCIISLLVPFLPSFDFCVLADESVSVGLTDPDYVRWLYNETGLYIDMDDTLNPFYPFKLGAPFSQQVEWFLADNGYVVKDPISAVIDSVQSRTNLQILEKQGAEQLYQYAISNNFPTISQNIVNNTITYARNNTPYYIYQAMHVSEFFKSFYFSNDWNQANYPVLKENLIDKVNSLNTLCAFTIPGTSITRHPTYLLSISQNIIDNYYFYKRSGIFWSFPIYPYQAYVNIGVDYQPLPTPPSDALSGRLSLSDGTSEYQGSIFYYGNGPLLNQTDLSSMNDFYNYLFCGCYNDFRTNGDWGHFSGTCYLIPDSWGDYNFLVFKDNSSLFSFVSGGSNVYRFSSDLDLSRYGQDIDYSKLYDIISDTVSGSSGNVIDAINNAVDNYLQVQIDLLHDINNALNDGSGQSWLRRIYDILDYNFPLTLTALQDLKHAIENISVTGGSADLTYTNQVLDQINEKLGFLIDQPVLDGTPQDFEELRTLAQNKFPFCVFSDIVALTVILNQSPEEPRWQVPLKLPGSASANNVEVDLSWYEYIRDYVHSIFIFMFIIGLLVLSVKIFDAVKS